MNNQKTVKSQRVTPITTLIMEFIESGHSPFSAQDLIDFLQQSGLKVNKTTVYRQLDSYLSRNILQTVNLNDGVVRYEVTQEHCHHHIVCRKCKSVAHVELGSVINDLQSKLAKESGFRIDEHMLEFFGKCANCK